MICLIIYVYILMGLAFTGITYTTPSEMLLWQRLVFGFLVATCSVGVVVILAGLIRLGSWIEDHCPWSD